MNENNHFDLLIINGRVIDPLTSFDSQALVGIRDGQISLVETVVAGEDDKKKYRANRTIDACGNIVAPGFINIHGHEGVLHETLTAAVLDGVTTTVGGQCGYSPGFPDKGNPIDSYCADIESGKLTANFIALAGHNTFRTWAGVKDQNTGADDTQIKQMLQLLNKEMEAGALGISFGPGYHPGASYEEMLSLANEAYRLGGMATIHSRFPVPPLNIDAFQEAIKLAEESSIPLMISHITGSSYGGKYGDTGQGLEIIAMGLQKDLKLATDCTLHDATVGPLTIPLLDSAPPDVLLEVVDAVITDFRVLNAVSIDGKPYMKPLERFKNTEQLTIVRDKAKQGEIPDPGLVGHIFKPHKQWLSLSQPFTMVANDAWVVKDEATNELTAHPRLSGTYSHFFGYWIREKKLTDLMTGLYKCSTAAALFCGLERKGRLQPGCDADIVIFDHESIIDTADYTRDGWNSAPKGIDWVIVNGTPVVNQGTLTGAKPGKTIRRSWSVPGVLKGPWSKGGE